MKQNSSTPFQTREFITFTQAAKLLGYSSGMIIHKLINEGHLHTYTFPDSPKKLVDKNDVLNLIQPSDQEEADKTS
jgi:predicted DNA-binding transcriptional regulator AlpA